MSQSGEGNQLWLNGFIAQANGSTFAFVVLLEEDDDLTKLLAIGQTLVEALDQP